MKRESFEGTAANEKRTSGEVLERAANGTRTRDLLITNELLYQLS